MYRSGITLLAGSFAQARQSLPVDAPRPIRPCVFLDRAEPRMVALFEHHPGRAAGEDPIAVIERASAVAGSLHDVFGSVQRALAALDARLDDDLAARWSLGAHAVGVTRVGVELALVAAGNGRLYRLRAGRVTTLFAGQTVAAQLLDAQPDPTALHPNLERVVSFALGAQATAPGWHGPASFDAEPGDRLLLTTYRTIEGMTSDELAELLSEPDRERAARTVVIGGKAKAEDQRRGWPWGEAAVVDVVGG